MKRRFLVISTLLIGLVLGLNSCGRGADPNPGSDGPANPGTPAAHQLGDAEAGRDVFRFETFGDEGFWTDAVRLPAGMMEARVTPLEALKLGLQVDIDALDAATRQTLTEQLRADPSGETSALLNDPAVTVALINANAVIGLPAVDSNGDGTVDITAGDKVGASCALCHSVADGSTLSLPNGGAIGQRRDGLATHSLDFGSLLAMGTNSRAFYPVLQLALDANGGNTIGRGTNEGLTETSSEAEVDAYLTDKTSYPVGMFDDTVDGNGDPMHNSALFRQDLAFPFGTEGSISREDNFANLVYTALLDPTIVTTPGGRAFMKKLGGEAAGQEIADDYVKVLAETGVTGYPFLQASPPDNPADAGTEAFPLGLRVDDTKLFDMNAYLFALQAPPGVVTDADAVARGRQLFRTVGCTGCHNADQSKFRPDFYRPDEDHLSG